MLKLVNIVKDYPLTKENVVHALKDISIEFPKVGLISILGQSGCGKTTLLNIIGGLDKYTSGDLIVDNKSTTSFNDHDWDTYRNKQIGMIFQSYNLIPHMTCLANVELALSLSGVDSKTRKQVAINALEAVGLQNEINKYPNQLSGGQQQRVSIARALVNNPSIILADEPTGALDSKTSIQVMEILEKIGQEKLVIMVTHNRNLAFDYSTQIIEMSDGKVLKNYKNTPKKQIKSEASSEIISTNLSKAKKTKNNSSMPLLTAMFISIRSMLTKKGRMIMTSIAGSFGIIGIALILAIANGFSNYISNMQEETLASYPLTVDEMWMDVDSLETTNELEKYPTDQEVNITKTPDLIYSNNITDEYISYINKMDNEYYSSLQFNYALQTNVITSKSDGTYATLATKQQSLVNSLTSSTYWNELPANKDFVLEKYDLIEGTYPSSANELVLVVSRTNSISENILSALGYDTNKDKISFTDVLSKVFKKISNNEYYEQLDSLKVNGYFLKDQDELKKDNLTIAELYESLVNAIQKNKDGKQNELLEALTELKSKYFKSEKETRDIYAYKLPDSEKLEELYKSSKEDLKIVGILRPKKSTTLELLSTGIYYSHELLDDSITEANKSTIATTNLNNLVLEDNSVASTMLNQPLPFIYSLTPKSNQTTPYKMNELKIDLSNISNLNSILTSYAQNTINSLQTYINNRKIVGTDVMINSITIYPKSFESKNKIMAYLDKYNEGKEKDQQIRYTDIAGTLFSTLEQLVNIISAVLIAFSSISLIVSSVMIGIIMYSSVIERTKEIGILRAIGARKKDISHLFKTEAVILGFLSGLFGIIVTYIACIPINLILSSLYPDLGLTSIAYLNPLHALILIIISMFLTYVSALIPARFAAKKDPVKALRTE